jgi:hydroxyacylglutathione hydrolase
MKYDNVIVGPLETNCYLIYCEETLECAIMDPGAQPEKIIQSIAALNLKPVILINTHGHVDHVGANKDIKERYDVPLFMHEADAPMLNSILQSGLGLFLGAKHSPPPDRFLDDGDEVKIGSDTLKTLHTPGHSPGSLSFIHEGLLFSGDTLFCGGVGRTDLPGGSWEELIVSIQNKILSLPDETWVLPGHGPHSTVGQERSENPFIQ